MKLGDRVIHNDSGNTGKIIALWKFDKMEACVKFDNGKYVWVDIDCLTKIDAEVWKEKKK